MDKITGTGFYLSQGGEEFILLENDYPLAGVIVPKENETSETVTFNDESGNEYQLKIKTTLTELLKREKANAVKDQAEEIMRWL